MATNKQDKTTSQPIDKETAQIIALELFKLQQAEQDGAKRNGAKLPEKHEAKPPKPRASAKIENGTQSEKQPQKMDINAKNVVKCAIIVFYVVVEILLLIYLKQFIFT